MSKPPPDDCRYDLPRIRVKSPSDELRIAPPSQLNLAVPRVKVRDRDGLPAIEEILAPTDPIARNLQITSGYVTFASRLQGMLDPEYPRARTSGVSPNWFAIGAYASNAAGKALVAIEECRALVEQLPTLPLAVALEWAGLDSGPAELLAQALQRGAPYGLLREAVPIMLRLNASIPGTELPTFADVRLLVTQARRLRALWTTAPGRTELARLDAILATLQNTLAEGNRAIFEDMAGAARDYLRARAALPRFDARALSLSLANEWAQGLDVGALARRAEHVFAVMHRHARLGGVIDDLSEIFDDVGPDRSRVLLLAGFLLFEVSRDARDPDERDRAIQAGNNLLAWREQRDVLQPVFDRRVAGEVNRRAVMQAVTPFMNIPIGSVTWRLSDYARSSDLPVIGGLLATIFGSDFSPLEAPSTQHDWAEFKSRWRAIQDVFSKAYADPIALWQELPEPDPRRTRQR